MTIKEAILEAAIDDLEEIAKELDQRQAEKLRIVIQTLEFIALIIPFGIYEAEAVPGLRESLRKFSGHEKPLSK